MPVSFFIGPVRLTPYRITLIFLFIPSLVRLLSGAVGAVRSSDLLMIIFTVWGVIALTVTTPLDEALEPAGIFVLESLGAFLLARTLITDERSFRAMVRFVVTILIFLIPFAAFETVTGRPILLDLVRPFLNVAASGDIEPRFGFHRAQVVFEHPILYGTFASSVFGLSLYVVRLSSRRFIGKASPFLVVFASILSVSTGALAALVVQFLFSAWDYVTGGIKNRWKIIGLGLIGLYVTIDLLSNRTPFHVIVTYLTFSSGSSYQRILIWNYGTAEVARHPLFGIGLADWERPSWMGSSMDNFWLVIAVTYGLPALIFLASAIILILRKVGRKKFQSQSLTNCRAGLFVSLAGLIVSGGTVHFWNASYCWFMFLVGSGMWMLNQPDKTATDKSMEPIRQRQRQRSQYSQPQLHNRQQRDRL